MGAAATASVLMNAEKPVMSPNDHPNPSQGQQMGLGKCRIFENFQVPLNSLNNGNFRGFLGCPWPGLHGLTGPYVGPYGHYVVPMGA